MIWKKVYFHWADKVFLVKIGARRFVDKMTCEQFDLSSSVFLDLSKNE